jgi:mutator protein MutT
MRGIPTGVQVIFAREDRVLLMRRAGTGFFDGLYSLPGGHVEEGESIATAARREMSEELGVSVTTLTTLGVVHRRSDTNRIDFFMRAIEWSGEPVIAEPDKCDALEWFQRTDLPDELVPYIREVLAAGEGPWIIELGWE